MANAGHVDLVRDRVEHWNDWRRKNTRVVPDFAGADLSELNLAGANLAKADLVGACLGGANLSGASLARAKLFRADLSQADLSRASLFKANLSQADLGGANLNGADLSGALLIKSNLSGASLIGACLKGANLGQASFFRARLAGAVLRGASLFKSDLSEADLSGADLEEANLQEAVLERTNLHGARLANANLCFATLLRADLRGAVLDNCAVHGISLWETDLADAAQRDLDIMPPQQPVLSVDGLPTAQLVGLLLHERSRADVFSVTLNTVLVIGRFPDERQPVLTAIKEALRRGGYAPLVLDFDRPGPGDKAEIVKSLGRMSQFVVADLTEDLRIAETLDAVVHFLPSVPIQPIGQAGREKLMAEHHFSKYRWVLPLWGFRDADDLSARFGPEAVAPAERKAAEARQKPSSGL